MGNSIQNGNSTSTVVGIHELAETEHLSWQISKGLAVGDASDFDLWLSSFWRNGEPSAQCPENLVIRVKRPVTEDQEVEWRADGDRIVGLARHLNGYYLVVGSELAKMPCIFDLDVEPLDQRE